MKKVVLTLICVAFLSVYLSADVYIKTQMHTDPMSIMGQKTPASDITTEMWIGKDKMAQISPQMSGIVDVAQKTICIINHGDKTYVETSYPLDFSKLIDPQFASMLGMIKMSAKVTPSGQTQKIGQWNCSGYDMETSVMMATIKTKVWATTEVPFDWKLYAELAFNTAVGKIFDEASVAEMKKIKGVQIATETTMEMMGTKVNSNSKVLEISQKAATAGVYSVPAGYTKKDTLDLTKMMGK